MKGDLDGPAADVAVKPASTSAPQGAIKSAASEHDGATKLNAPDMFAQFRVASSVVSEDAFAPPTPGASPKVV
jgi:hypothetical protein